MTRIDTYKHLDKDTSVTVELPMTEIAKRACALNYGSHRLLSAMVHELRRERAEYIAERRAHYSTKPPECRIIYTAEEERSPLADAIEAALNQGHYY